MHDASCRGRSLNQNREGIHWLHYGISARYTLFRLHVMR